MHAQSALITSNVNMDPLVVELADLGFSKTGYNTLLQILQSCVHDAANQDNGLICIYLDIDEYLSDTEDRQEALDIYYELLKTAVEACPQKTFIVNLPWSNPSDVTTFIRFTDPNSSYNLAGMLRMRLLELKNSNGNFEFYDPSYIFFRLGEDAVISDMLWYAGRIKYQLAFFKELAFSIRRLLDARNNRIMKVLVVDLDNTLWGIAGIALSEDGVGKCYRDFQKQLALLQKMGVLLAVCSKNNRKDVERVFTEHPMMVLKLEDFVDVRVNWAPKPENIIAMSNALGLGMDSFVFIDDSPVERESVKFMCPGVHVPTFPDKPEKMVRWLIHEVAFPFFPKSRNTVEDVRRHDSYKSRVLRKAEQSRFDTYADFIARLQIHTNIFADDMRFVDRYVQLCQRTNQFNLTTRRYSHHDITRFITKDEFRVLAIEYDDRFGKEGLIGLCIINLHACCVDSFMISCRVIGRNVEFELLKRIDELFKTRERGSYALYFEESEKNSIARAFFDSVTDERVIENNLVKGVREIP